MGYIYEQHVTLIRISYILPANYFCEHIHTSLYQRAPYDLTTFDMRYGCFIYSTENEVSKRYSEYFYADSLPDLVEKVRLRFISLRSKHSDVNKSHNITPNLPT